MESPLRTEDEGRPDLLQRVTQSVPLDSIMSRSSHSNMTGPSRNCRSAMVCPKPGPEMALGTRQREQGWPSHICTSDWVNMTHIMTRKRLVITGHSSSFQSENAVRKTWFPCSDGYFVVIWRPIIHVINLTSVVLNPSWLLSKSMM
jgi:hypothetical protein